MDPHGWLNKLYKGECGILYVCIKAFKHDLVWTKDKQSQIISYLKPLYQ